MKRTLLALSLITYPLSLIYAQSTTRAERGTDSTLAKTFASNSDNSATHKLLLIPFYPDMCMSEIDKDVNGVTHEDFKHITEDFRKALDLAMYSTLHQSYITISLLQGKNKSDSVLNYIYGSTGYNYDLVPGTDPDAVKSSDSAKRQHYIVKGQLQVPQDYSKRFMNVAIKNPKLLPYLYKRYHTDTFVFINELDIKNVDNPTENLAEDTYRRLITVHYSILNEDGKSVIKGIATTYFPFGENNPTEIGQKYFTVLARNIFKDYSKQLDANLASEQQKQNTTQPKGTATNH
jgi:hypothetical protein